MAIAQTVLDSGNWICKYSPLLLFSAHQLKGPFKRPLDGLKRFKKCEEAVKVELGNFPPSAAPRGSPSHGVSIRKPYDNHWDF